MLSVLIYIRNNAVAYITIFCFISILFALFCLLTLIIHYSVILMNIIVRVKVSLKYANFTNLNTLIFILIFIFKLFYYFKTILPIHYLYYIVLNILFHQAWCNIKQNPFMCRKWILIIFLNLFHEVAITCLLG